MSIVAAAMFLLASRHYEAHRQASARAYERRAHGVSTRLRFVMPDRSAIGPEAHMRLTRREVGACSLANACLPLVPVRFRRFHKDHSFDSNDRWWVFASHTMVYRCEVAVTKQPSMAR